MEAITEIQNQRRCESLGNLCAAACDFYPHGSCVALLLDPLHLLVGAALGASCAIGGQLAGRRRNENRLAMQLGEQIALVKQASSANAGNAINALAVLRLKLDEISDVQQQHEQRLNVQVVEQGKRDEVMARLAMQQQRLSAQTPQPQPQPQLQQQLWAQPTAPAPAQVAEMAQNAGLADLAALQRAAQVEFARRQRAAAEASFQQPQGGGQ